MFIRYGVNMTSDYSGIAVVDITGYDYSDSSSQTISGLYAKCDTAYKSGKVVLIKGWDYNGALMSPMYVYLMPSTNAYVIDGKLSVSNQDAVTRL